MARRKESSSSRGYIYRWEKARRQFLLDHPLCCMCEAEGRLRPATVVDHIVPHKGDEELFWNPSNWQALCKYHHDSVKQRFERTGRIIGCDEHGIPLDPRSHWHKPPGAG